MSGPRPAEGWRLSILETVDSTNDEALRRIAAGAGAGEAILARAQTAGRGRYGRGWASAPGNLHLSVTLAPPPGRPAGELAFVAGLAAAEGLEQAAGGAVRIGLKWPNDLLQDGRKLGGLLIEGTAGGDRGILALGLGVNLVSFPEGADWPATSLAAAGCAVAADAAAQAFCDRLAARLGDWEADGFAPVRAAWLARAVGLGRPLVARLPGGTAHEGLFRDIDEQGALVLQTGDGSTRRIVAGAVFPATD